MHSLRRIMKKVRVLGEGTLDYVPMLWIDVDGKTYGMAWYSWCRPSVSGHSTGPNPCALPSPPELSLCCASGQTGPRLMCISLVSTRGHSLPLLLSLFLTNVEVKYLAF